MSNYETPQEEFWAGNFGDEYIGRNQGDELLSQNLKFFTTALKQSVDIKSCLELGANVGMNLRALELLSPGIDLDAVEINPGAAQILRDFIGKEKVFEGSIFDFPCDKKYDLVLIKTVLIHINPEMLDAVYEKLYKASNKYVLICEYYNPTPVTVNYRGQDDRLFKRDFAGEILDKYNDLKLIDYGFAYGRLPSLLDDITWFLLEKTN
jgi:spore coat polysaccharide biosynthesis protein SpsF